jgi:hypothetical protein
MKSGVCPKIAWVAEAGTNEGWSSWEWAGQLAFSPHGLPLWLLCASSQQGCLWVLGLLTHWLSTPRDQRGSCWSFYGQLSTSLSSLLLPLFVKVVIGKCRVEKRGKRAPLNGKGVSESTASSTNYSELNIFPDNCAMRQNKKYSQGSNAGIKSKTWVSADIILSSDSSVYQDIWEMT